MKRAILLEGNFIQSQGVLNKVKDYLGEYELHSFDERCSYDFVQKTILEFSCFGEKKLVLISGVPKISAPSKSQARTKVMGKFQKVISKIPRGTIVVFNNLGIRSKKFKSAIEAVGTVYEFEKKFGKHRAITWLEKKFKSEDKVVKLSDIEVMVNSFGVDKKEIDYDDLYLLFLKVMQYIGVRKNINLDDIHNVCLSSREFEIWSIYESFDDKDFCSAMSRLQDILYMAKYVESEVVQLLSNMEWRYKMMILVKDGIVRGLKEKDINKELSNIYKLGREGKADRIRMSVMEKDGQPSSMFHPYAVSKLFEPRGRKKPPIQCYSRGELFLINYSLGKAFEKIRSGCTEHEILMTVELVFMTVCGKIKKMDTLNLLTSNKLMTLKEYRYE